MKTLLLCLALSCTAAGADTFYGDVPIAKDPTFEPISIDDLPKNTNESEINVYGIYDPSDGGITIIPAPGEIIIQSDDSPARPVFKTLPAVLLPGELDDKDMVSPKPLGVTQ